MSLTPFIDALEEESRLLPDGRTAERLRPAMAMATPLDAYFCGLAAKHGVDLGADADLCEGEEPPPHERSFELEASDEQFRQLTEPRESPVFRWLIAPNSTQSQSNP